MKSSLFLSLLLVFTLAILGCNPRPSSAPPNLASEFVVAIIDSDAKCTSVYVDVGETHQHAARCKLPSKAVIYCTISTDKGPHCESLIPAPSDKTAERVPAPSPAASPEGSGKPPSSPPPKAP